MEFRIADSFTASLTKLTAQEQKAVKTTAFDMQMNQSGNGLSFHRLDGAQDKNFWSVRVNADIRIIVHKTESSILLVYADHHDKAYKWAERRKIERHPTTGAMQLVEVRELVAETEIYKAPSETPKVAASQEPLFKQLRKFELMAFGVPEDWVDDVRKATEETLFDIIEHLPQEAQEALLMLATGGKPVPAEPTADQDSAFAHPDAQRRFRLMTDVEELRAALEYPWDKWAVFLHPEQQALVAKKFNGPARVSGSAGTGKTIVALHRAAHLARENPGAKVLLTTFSKGLANALRSKLHTLLEGETGVRDRIEVKPISAVGYDLYREYFAQPNLASQSHIQAALLKASKAVEGHSFNQQFLSNEWNDVVDAWQLTSWEDYRDVTRLGRKTRVGPKQREMLWQIFEKVRAELSAKNLITWSGVFDAVAKKLAATGRAPYQFAVLDEAQDLSVAEARFLASLSALRPDALFFAGDIGQRIFQQPFSWKALGIDVRGRSATLRINYRTSHEIRRQADRLLPPSVADVDGNAESRKGTISLFNGPAPLINEFPSSEAEVQFLAEQIQIAMQAGVAISEIAVFVRSEAEMPRARAVAKALKVKFTELDETSEVEEGRLVLSTMHFAKGLEFKCVFVMACDDEIVPQSERLALVTDKADLEAVYETERHLLYVACTRARDQLIMTGVSPISEFLYDLID